MCLATSRAQSIAPVKLTARILFQHSRVILVIGFPFNYPRVTYKYVDAAQFIDACLDKSDHLILVRYVDLHRKNFSSKLPDLFLR